MNFQSNFTRKEKKIMYWLKLKELLRLQSIYFYTTKKKFLIKIIQKSNKFRIHEKQDITQLIHRDEIAPINLLSRTVVLFNVPQRTLTSELKKFFSVHGVVYSIFLKMLERKERKKYAVQNVELIWKKVEEAQLFEKIRSISFPKKCFNRCLFTIKFIRDTKYSYFFRSTLLKSLKVSKLFRRISKRLEREISECKSLRAVIFRKIVEEKSHSENSNNFFFELIKKQSIEKAVDILFEKRLSKNKLKNIETPRSREMFGLRRKLLKLKKNKKSMV